MDKKQFNQLISKLRRYESDRKFWYKQCRESISIYRNLKSSDNEFISDETLKSMVGSILRARECQHIAWQRINQLTHEIWSICHD